MKPRIISDNGPQFIAKDFKAFIRIVGMTHVRITPGYPSPTARSSDGTRLLRATLFVYTALEIARKPRSSSTTSSTDHYNNRRLHSAIGYVTPADKLAGHERKIWAERDRKLEAARELRRQRRQANRPVTSTPTSTPTARTAVR